MSAKELADSAVQDVVEASKHASSKTADGEPKAERRGSVDLGWSRAEKFAIRTSETSLLLSYVVVVDNKAYQCSLFTTSDHAKENEAVLDALVKSLRLEKSDLKENK